VRKSFMDGPKASMSRGKIFDQWKRAFESKAIKGQPCRDKVDPCGVFR